MKKLLGGMAALATTFLIGCGDDVNKIGYDQGKTKGTVNFVLQDVQTDDYVDSVAVSVVKNGVDQEFFTDSVGQVSITGLEVGSYEFVISKDGYADMFVSAAIGLDPTDTEVPLVWDETLILDIHKEGASIEGKLRFTDEDGNEKAADGAIIDVFVDYGIGGIRFVDRKHTITVSETGDYASASSLPVLATYFISPRKYTADEKIYTFGGTQTVAGVNGGEVELVTPMVMGLQAAALTVMTTNFADLKVNDKLVITFSEPVDETEIEKDDIQVTRGGNIIDIATVFAKEGRELTISAVDGKWQEEDQHTLSLDLKSLDGATLQVGNVRGGFSFKAEGDLDAPATLIYYRNAGSLDDTSSVNSTDNQLNLAWGMVSGATGYYIYAQSFEDDNAIIIGETFADDDTTITVNTNKWFTEGDEAVFYVKAYNATNASAASPKITVKDNVLPEITTNSFVVVGSDNTGNNDADEIRTITIQFSEDMAEGQTPKFSEADDKLDFEWEWDDANTGTLTIFAKADTDASGILEIVVNAEGLTDEAGNKGVGSDARWESEL